MEKERFEKIRLDLGLTQTELGKILGISRMAVYRFEKGVHPVSMVSKNKLITYMNKLKKGN